MSLEIIQIDDYTNYTLTRVNESIETNSDERYERSEEIKTTTSSIFGGDTTWLFRAYNISEAQAAGRMTAVSDTSTRDYDGVPGPRLGAEPRQPRGRKPAAMASGGYELAAMAASAPGQVTYLFNVWVAFEWKPSIEELTRYKWAFKRASDFLYDVTDGGMAFGQVVFLGPRRLPHADIQILASSRLQARSWVNALHEPKKHTPIRLGRGVWRGRDRILIPWDEPEGYRVIIHEWAHYALGLHDAYLSLINLPQASSSASPTSRKAHSLLWKEPIKLVVPELDIPGDSIMESLVGTSELGGKDLRRRPPNWLDEINTIRERFPGILERTDQNADSGPGELPFPLPQFLEEDGLRADDKQPIVFPMIKCQQETDGTGSLKAWLAAKAIDSRGTPLDHFWLYVIKNNTAEEPTIIAQGTLDARALYRDFPLLGADIGDLVILVIDVRQGNSCVLRSTIQENRELGEWTDVTPGDAHGTIHVLPGPVGAADQKEVEVRLKFDSTQIASSLSAHPCAAIRDGSKPCKVDKGSHLLGALDGHLLLLWGKETKLTVASATGVLITPFSQGGGPESGDPHAPPQGAPPITAGASDGGVLLYFKAPDDALDIKNEGGSLKSDVDKMYSRVRVITTVQYAAQLVVSLPKDVVPRSTAYSLASNEWLPAELNPTLVMAYDEIPDVALLAEEFFIYRLDRPAGTWQPLPSYHNISNRTVAAPLTSATAPTLLEGDGPDRAEVFMVCSVPRVQG